MKIPKKTLIVSVIAISALVGVVYAANLLVQDFPTITVPAVSFSSTCTTATTGDSVLVPLSAATPSSGTILFGCGTAAAPAPAFTTVAGSFTPTYSGGALPGPYTHLNLVAAPTTGTPSCTGTTIGPITQGVAVTLTAGSYYYCASYTGVANTGGSLPPFSVFWN